MDMTSFCEFPADIKQQYIPVPCMCFVSSVSRDHWAHVNTLHLLFCSQEAHIDLMHTDTMSTSCPTPKAPTPLPRKKKVHMFLCCFEWFVCVWLFVHHLQSCRIPICCWYCKWGKVTWNDLHVLYIYLSSSQRLKAYLPAFFWCNML